MDIQLTKTQIAILESLCERWYEFLLPENISKTKKISLSSVYASLKGLKKMNGIFEQNGSFRINFSNEIVWAFKRIYDASKLVNSRKEISSKVQKIREKAELFFADDLIAFLVFGSVASGDVNEDSDIDYLVIVKEKNQQLNFLNFLTSEERNFHYIERSINEFTESYDECDDFIISVLKNNIILLGADYLRPYFELDLPKVSKKVIDEREKQLKELKEKIDKIFFDDPVLFHEKVRELIKLKCRLLLMKLNIVPASNKELLEKIKESYPLYFKAYTTLKQSNAKDVYLKMEIRYYE